MKTLIITLFVLLITQTNKAQKNIHLGANISPSITFPVTNPQSTNFDAHSNFSYGLSVLLSFNDRLFIQTGLNFNQKSFSIENIPDTRAVANDIYGNSDIINGGRINYDQINTYNDYETFQSINLPLTLMYLPSEVKNTNLVFSGGIEIGYLFNVRYIWDHSSGGQDIYNIKHNQFIGSINLGLGLYQSILNNYTLVIIPKYSYSFYPDMRKIKLSFHSIYIDTEFYFHLN